MAGFSDLLTIGGDAGLVNPMSMYAGVILSATGLDDAIDLLKIDGFLRIDIGSPRGQNISVTSSNGAYQVVPDNDSVVYPDARITAQQGSEAQQILQQLYTTQNYGEKTQLKVIKNKNRASTTGTSTDVYIIRCFKTPGDPSGFGITNNTPENTEVIFPMEIQLISRNVG